MAETSNRGSNARDKAQEASSSARQAVQDVKHAGQAAVAAAGQKTQEMGSAIGQKVHDAASNVGQKAQDLASTATEKADSALSSVGQSMSSLAGTIRHSAPHEGFLGTAATTVADQLQTGGRYLQQHGLGDMAEDLAGVVRRHPLPAICMAFGLGWVLGMGSRR